MYAQYADDVEDLLNATWEWKESNRREPGSTKVVQLLDVFVDQSFAARCVSGGGSAQELRNHVLNTPNTPVFVTRAPSRARVGFARRKNIDRR